MLEPRIQHFHDPSTGTLSYVVDDERSGRAAVIDPVLGYAIESGRTSTGGADSIIRYLEENGLEPEWILETHAHADHLSAAQYLKSKLGGKVAIGEGIRQVQAHFVPVFGLESDLLPDGSQFDQLFADGDVFRIGELDCEVIATPGHTSDSVSYRIGASVFVGDIIFMPDFGTARCDFPGGDAGLLYDSIHRVLALPEDTTLYMCHDYQPGGRELRWASTVAEQKAHNIHVHDGVSKKAFRKMRSERDAGLGLPKLIIPAIQVNIRAGHLPGAEDNGIAYIKVPLDTL